MKPELLLLSSPESTHPAAVQVFSDPESLCHVVVGWFAGRLPPHWAIALTTAFAGYQLSQANTQESFARIGCELLEFAVGVTLAQFTRSL